MTERKFLTPAHTTPDDAKRTPGGLELSSGRRIKADRVGAEKHKHRIGEHLAGDRRETSPYELSFNDDVEWRLLCKTTLGSAELNKLKEAVDMFRAPEGSVDVSA